MITLLVTNVDGARVDGSWDHSPTKDELRYCIGGMWETEKEDEVIDSLIKDRYISLDDSACTTYELNEN